MGRSQRHKIMEQNTSSRGEVYAEGALAPAVLKQLPPPPVPTVPAGPSGGPLKGSSMSGAIPVGFITPTPHDGEPTLLPAPDQPAPPATASDERTFPIGPLNLVRIEPSDDPLGAWYVVSKEDGTKLVEGDDITVEATGSTLTNGDFVVEQLQESDTERRFFVPDVVLAAQVDAKGRVTVTDGAI